MTIASTKIEKATIPKTLFDINPPSLTKKLGHDIITFETIVKALVLEYPPAPHLTCFWRQEVILSKVRLLVYLSI